MYLVERLTDVTKNMKKKYCDRFELKRFITKDMKESGHSFLNKTSRDGDSRN